MYSKGEDLGTTFSFTMKMKEDEDFLLTPRRRTRTRLRLDLIKEEEGNMEIRKALSSIESNGKIEFEIESNSSISGSESKASDLSVSVRLD